LYFFKNKAVVPTMGRGKQKKDKWSNNGRELSEKIIQREKGGARAKPTTPQTGDKGRKRRIRKTEKKPKRSHQEGGYLLPKHMEKKKKL